MNAAPYVVLGIFLAIGICLMIGSGVSQGTWYSMYVAIPALLTVISHFGITSFEEDVLSDDIGLMSVDSWYFCCAVCFTSCIGLPVIYYRLDWLTGLGLGLTIGGAFSILIGLMVSEHLRKKQELQ